MNIGDLLLRLLADGSKLEADVVKEAGKAGDAGAKTLGQKLSSGLKTNGLKAFSAVAAGVFAGMTKGALELEDVQARFQSETGESADAAAHAAQVINKAAGDNRLSLEEVADAAVKVHNDLGLTGDAADKATAKFAQYARVTRQQAGAAVSAFDDILDSWGLTAADATDLMDKLIVSHQKFGGSVEENQVTLAALAPAMRAANMSINDGIALLNVFGAKGLDAGQASAAFAKALTKVKSPRELQDLITDISNTKDPFERAAKAADLFGAKAGAKLANALDGVNLDDYAVSMEEAAGATDKAAEAADSGFGNRFRKLMSQARAAVRGFGADFGPALTAAASVGSLASTVFPGVGKKIAAGIGTGLAAGKDKIAAGLATALEGVGSSPAVKAAAGKASQFLGTTMGKAMGVAFAAAAAFELAITFNELKQQLDAQAAELSQRTAQFVQQATKEQLQAALLSVQQARLQIGGFKTAFNSSGLGIFGEMLLGDTTTSLQAQEDAIQKQLGAIEQAGGEVPKALVGGMQRGKPKVDSAMQAMGASVLDNIDKLPADAEKVGGDMVTAFADGIVAEQNKTTDAMHQLREQMRREMSPMTEIARNVGILTSETLAKGLNDKRPGVRREAQRVREDAEAKLVELIAGGGKAGKGAMEELRRKMHSKNPAIRREAQRVYNIVTGKLEAIKKPAGDAGRDSGRAFISNFKRSISAGGIVTIKVRTSDDTKGGRASGGPVLGGVPVWVNEHTPRSELFVPTTPGHVLTHADAVSAIQHAAAGGGGDTINVPVTVQGALPVRTIRDVSREMQRVARLGLVPEARLSPMYRREEAARR